MVVASPEEEGGGLFREGTEAEIKWNYRGDIREYFNESKIA